jgi:two-component system OmpR family response regulator
MDRTAEAPAVLVVEDESAVRRLLELALHLHGFRVLLAANGQEAVDLYQQQHEAIALVLTDVRMPGLDGPETLAALQQINPAVRCCFMSGNTGPYTADGLRELGAAFIDKPFSLDALAALLGEVADRPG